MTHLGHVESKFWAADLIDHYTRARRETVAPYRDLRSMRAADDLVGDLKTLPYADRIREEPVLQRKEPRQIDG